MKAILRMTSGIIILYINGTGLLMAKDVYPLDLLQMPGQQKQFEYNEDISVFANSNYIPGRYDVNVFINKIKIEQLSVNFQLMLDNNDNEKLTPCFTKEELASFGFITDSIPDDIIDKNNYVNLNKISFIQTKLKLGDESLYLTVPQALFNTEKIHELEKKRWDNGIPALYTNYSFSGFTSGKNINDNSSYYLNLNSGINIGAWRYRNYSTWQKNSNSESSWNTLSNTFYRNIEPISSELSLGDLYSSTWMFDSINLKGIKLETDTLMKPAGSSTYAPNVTGIANSESIVTIRQNGQVIYRKSISAGQFNINDYSPMNSGGNLYVTIEGSDGAENTFIVPFSTIPNLENKGSIRYSLSLGEYDGNNRRDGDFVSQLDFYAGVTQFVTLSGGLQASDKYKSLATGVGVNLGDIGAVSSNLIISDAKLSDDKNYKGKSIKINYAKIFNQTNTNVSLAGYQYFDEKYYTFEDAMNTYYKNDSFYLYSGKLKHKFILTMNQSIGEDLGSVNLSTSYFNYTDEKNISSYNASYSNAFKNITYNVNLTKYINNDYNAKENWLFGLNLSIPLEWENRTYWVGSNSMYNSSNDQFDTSTTIGSSLGDKNQFSWGLYQNLANNGNDYSAGVSGNYRSSYGAVNASYSKAKNNESLNYGVTGSLVATQYGAALANTLTEANAIVLVRDIDGIESTNSGMRTNSFGVGLQTGLTPYRNNSIVLDTKSIPNDAEITNNIASNMIPTRGAIILSDFKVQNGRKLLININNDLHIPLGSVATLDNGEEFYVSNLNQLFLISNADKGKIHIKWIKNDENNECYISYDLKDLTGINGITMFNASCR